MVVIQESTPTTDARFDGGPDIDIIDLAIPMLRHWKLLLFAPLLAGVVAVGVTYLMKPTFTSRTVFLPPQQHQGAAAATLASLGTLSGLIGATGGKSSADQFVALLQSTSIADRLIDEFKLMQVYENEFRFDARMELAKNSRVLLGKKDGLITIEVDDIEPQRAAAMANCYVEELRRLTGQLALTDAQQRRLFFEGQLKKTRDEMAVAQQALQTSGFSQGALKAEPKAAAEGYGRLKAEIRATEMRLQTLRRNLADSTPEVAQAQIALGALRSQLSKLEAATDQTGGSDYVSKFREFKYQETLFELLARQYELARLDESREGALIQVVDVAKPAESKSRPKRGITAVATTLATLLLLAVFVVTRHFWRQSSARPERAAKLAQLRAALD